MKHWLLSVAALTLPLAAPVEARKPIPAVKAPTEGMVSAADPRAAAAGVEILRAGGSATDAALRCGKEARCSSVRCSREAIAQKVGAGIKAAPTNLTHLGSWGLWPGGGPDGCIGVGLGADRGVLFTRPPMPCSCRNCAPPRPVKPPAMDAAPPNGDPTALRPPN